MASNTAAADGSKPLCPKKPKLHGRAFYESIGSPKLVLAPMVDASEFAWRLLSRSFMPQDQQKDLLAYTPMFHSRLFDELPRYREKAFQPLRNTLEAPNSEQLEKYTLADAHLDGNPKFDRPLFVQFCSNEPDDFLKAARYVAPFCDAVDLNLGCPQGIARKGHYGAFLQEDWGLIRSLINKLHQELEIPVTAKFRMQETPEKTLEYAKMILDAGASIITLHGRQRHQKGHETGLADWSVIKYLRDNLPDETVIFANGNILQHEDIAACLEATGADGVMSAEGNLHDPSIFAPPPPPGQEGREYWRGRDGKGGYRMDAVFRRYMDIIHRHVLGEEPPARKPLFMPSDPPAESEEREGSENGDEGQPARKKQRQSKREKREQSGDPNFTPMQAHLFRMLRPLISRYTNVRDALAKSRSGDIAAYENVLSMVEQAVKEGLIEYEKNPEAFETAPETNGSAAAGGSEPDPHESSVAAVNRCKRPWFICQPYVRPVPKEAMAKGSIQLSKKMMKKLERESEEARKAGVEPNGKVEEATVNGKEEKKVEIPKDGLVCG
ncbi:putative dihydrouridine synthase family protein [Phyllosticta capitalensis]|uniref:putative dihydrouridine synthase family protein n=1 Tax=Phyllosticta capitalensis TaxID=121624 RepID=UPI00312D950E